MAIENEELFHVERIGTQVVVHLIGFSAESGILSLRSADLAAK